MTSIIAGIERAIHLADRFRLRELGVLIAMFIIVAGTWGFIELADEVFEGDTQAFDEWVVRSLRQSEDRSLPLGPSWLAEAARDITALGSGAVLVLVIAAAAGYLWLRGKHHAAWLVLIATISGQAVGWILKESFSRERPTVVPHLADVTTPSFPSGHSMMSAVVFMTLGALLMRFVTRRRDKLYILSIGLLLTAFIGATRIYLGVHYPTDVLAGWTAGLVWAMLCWLTASYLQQRGAVEEA